MHTKSLLLCGAVGTALITLSTTGDTIYRATAIRLINDDISSLSPFFPGVDVHGTIGMNNLGEIVYAHYDTSDVARAFLWLPNAN